MGFLKLFKQYLGLGCLCLLLMSCGDGSSVPIKTTEWQLDGAGAVLFSTNDPQYYGYTFWHYYDATYQPVMTTVTGTVKKVSGSNATGSGIVFCLQDNENFYRVVIDPKGSYNVYSKVAGTYNPIITWTPSSRILQGYGVENVISIQYTAPDTFTLYINGQQEVTFKDSHFSGGKAGFYTGISTKSDHFPAVPMDVRFKLIAPAIYPY